LTFLDKNYGTNSGDYLERI